MFEVFESHFILLIEDSASRSIIEVFKFDKCLLRNDIGPIFVITTAVWGFTNCPYNNNNIVSVATFELQPSCLWWTSNATKCSIYVT